MRKFIAAVSFIIPSIAFSLYPQPLTPIQRVAEEKRIQQETEHNLDWHNLHPSQLDGIADDRRALYAGPNTSILISRVGRGRFGLFEGVNKEGILGYEVRFHQRNKLTARFDTTTNKEDCLKDSTLYIEEKLGTGFTMHLSCTNKNDANIEFFYFFHKESGKLFRLLQIDGEIKSGPKTKESNGRYVMSWKLKPSPFLGENITMKFEIQKKNGKWHIQTIDSPVEGYVADELDKLPLDHKYDLPDVINWDQ